MWGSAHTVLYCAGTLFHFSGYSVIAQKNCRAQFAALSLEAVGWLLLYFLAVLRRIE